MLAAQVNYDCAVTLYCKLPKLCMSNSACILNVKIICLHSSTIGPLMVLSIQKAAHQHDIFSGTAHIYIITKQYCNHEIITIIAAMHIR